MTETQSIPSAPTDRKRGAAGPAKHRWMKFYPEDWVGDPALSLCSLAAQGLWIRLICLAHNGTPYGHVTIGAGVRPDAPPVAPTPLLIGRLVGLSENAVKKLLKELEVAGVFSRTDAGVIYSRRMVRDREFQELSASWGRSGGNPSLKPTAKGRVNPPLGRGVFPESESESESESEQDARARAAVDIRKMPRLSDPPARWESLAQASEVDEDGSRHPVVGGYYLDVVAKSVCTAAGINDANWRGDWTPLVQWLQDGLVPDTVILPAISDVASRPKYVAREIRSLAYFDKAVRERGGKHAG